MLYSTAENLICFRFVINNYSQAFDSLVVILQTILQCLRNLREPQNKIT